MIGMAVTVNNAEVKLVLEKLDSVQLELLGSEHCLCLKKRFRKKKKRSFVKLEKKLRKAKK
jgi:hypothetical protein